MKLTMKLAGTDREFKVDLPSPSLVLEAGTGPIRTAVVNGKRIEFGWTEKDNTVVVVLDGIDYTFEINPRPGILRKTERLKKRSASGTLEIRAPIPGLVTSILVKPGEHIKKGQTVCTLDAMKLENEIASPHDGRIQSVALKPGTPVEKDQLLMTLNL